MSQKRGEKKKRRERRRRRIVRGGCLPEYEIYERNSAPKISLKSVDEEASHS